MNSATNGSFDSAEDDQCRKKFVRDLRSSLQYAVIQITAAADRNNGTKMSSRAIQALSELTFQYATTCLPNDLRAFSDHANRKKTINVEDVQLVVRKNPAISQKLAEFCENGGNNNNSVNPVGTIGAAFAMATSYNGKSSAAAASTSTGASIATSTAKRKSSIMDSLYYRAPATTSSSSSSSEDDDDINCKNDDKSPPAIDKKSTTKATSRPSWHTAAFRKRNDSSDDSSSDDSEIQILSSPPKKQKSSAPNVAILGNYDSESDDDSPPRRRLADEPYKSQAMQIIANMSPNTPPSPIDGNRNKRKKKEQRTIPMQPLNLNDDKKEEVKKKKSPQQKKGDLEDTDSEEVEWDSPEKGNLDSAAVVKGGASKRKVIEDDDTESEGY